MSARQRTRRGPAPAAPRRRSMFVPGLAVAVLAIAAAAFVVFRPSTAGGGASSATGLPGPIGGSSVAVDVNTMVGKAAPAFTLSDSDGTSFAVTPGQGRPIVLVSHMGIT